MIARKRWLSLLAAGALALTALPAAAAANLPIEVRMKPICAGCHWNDETQIRGTLVPGSQSEDSFKISTESKVWQVSYDDNTKMNKLASVLDLRDEKAMTIRFKQKGGNRVYAKEISYKGNYKFKDPQDTITIGEVNELLQQTPEEGNYMIIDARGYDRYIQGHLPNAVLLPHYRFSEFKDRLPEDKSTKIVAYCRGYG
ncbi:MAG: rhodanese-like domain-containing protein [Desulfurivibrio sp.]|nr:rhodanese-like domain-containing protein [Desulfurivibrio sp.]